MKKLKDLLNETINPQLGKVYSDPYAKSFVKENEDEESSEMTTEQKQAFLEAVKAYKSFGETVYRNEGLSEVYESIRGLVSVAGKNMVKETEGSFDGITVSRHVKRMNESFKIFEKTLREVATLQQRLESSYDEIGETLGKYYEINETDDSEIEEGNEFGAARAKAIAAGSDSFEVDGKTYPLKGVDKDDKENAKEFTKESMNLTDILKEGKDVGHYERVGNQTIVDSNFVNYSKGVLPNSELVHLGMGDFAIKSQSGTIKFQRSGKMDGIGQDFVGRPHRMTDDKNGKLVELFLKLMLKKKKAILSMSESVVTEARPGTKTYYNGRDVLPPHYGNSELHGKSEEMFKKPWEKLNDKQKAKVSSSFPKTESVNEDMAGWIAIDHKGNKLEIKKSEAKDLYNAKLLAIKKLKVPKSKVGMLAIKPAVDESVVNEDSTTYSLINPKTKEIVSRGLTQDMLDDFKMKKRIANAKLDIIPDTKVKKTKIDKSTGKQFMESVVNEAKYDIGMARKGNGLTIYNKAEEENGDYKNVAHIDNKGKIKYLDKKIPSNIKKEIEAEAKKMMEITNEGNSMIKLKNLLNESFGFGELPSSKLMKMKVSAKDMLDSVKNNKVNESEEDKSVTEARVSAKNLLQSVVDGETKEVEGIKLSKEMAEAYLNWLRMSPFGKKYGKLPFNKLFTASFRWGLHRHADEKSKEYKDLKAKAKGLDKK